MRKLCEQMGVETNCYTHRARSALMSDEMEQHVGVSQRRVWVAIVDGKRKESLGLGPGVRDVKLHAKVSEVGSLDLD